MLHSMQCVKLVLICVCMWSVHACVSCVLIWSVCQMERTPLMAAAQNQSVDSVLVLAKEFNCKKKNYLDKVRV